MLNKILFCGLAAGMAIATGTAKEFPLAFKTMKADEAMKSPGGYGSSASLRATAPAELKREPRAVSLHPIYGQLGGTGANGVLFRLDESKGDGRGYDRLIVDLNQNGDLTDDPVVAPVTDTSVKSAGSGSEQRLFGPIVAPVDETAGGGRPVYFAQMYLVNRQTIATAARSVSKPLLETPASRQSSVSTVVRTVQPYLGSLRFKAGWFLEAMVDMNGLRQRIGVYDSDSNLRLGDLWKGRALQSRDEKQYYFSVGDSFLRDADGSGKFDNNLFNTETSPYGPILYLGDKPFRVTLPADRRSIQVEPWPGALATLAVQPRGAQVRDLTLAWEQTPGQWQLLKTGVVNGKTTVPPGHYWVYNTFVAASADGGLQTMLSGYNRSAANAFEAVAGQTTPVRCGAPLEVKLTAAKASTVASEDYTLRIQAQVLGQAGETFSTFAKGRDFSASTPAAPTFRILAQNGAVIESGKMEFG
jgi:hypothetical protein